MTPFWFVLVSRVALRRQQKVQKCADVLALVVRVAPSRTCAFRGSNLTATTKCHFGFIILVARLFCVHRTDELAVGKAHRRDVATCHLPRSGAHILFSDHKCLNLFFIKYV
jgi:hypothetical protein